MSENAARSREPTAAAVRRIENVIAELDRWAYKNWQANHRPFDYQKRQLREAIDLIGGKRA